MNIPKFKSLKNLVLLEMRCSSYATIAIFSAAMILAIAFVTSFWLVSETIPEQRFRRLGLWEACFARLHDHYYRYDRVITGCKWIFDEDLAFMSDFLEPPLSSMARHSSSNRSQQYCSKQPPLAVNTSSRLHRSVEAQQTPTRVKLSANLSQPRLSVFIILSLAIILTIIAFFSTNWLEVERRYYGSKFKKLGLWRMCFNSFSAPDDLQFRKFYVGCRWIFADEYKPIRKFLLPAFFITTQVLYTIGFLLLVLVCAGIIAVQQCFIIEREDYALRALSVASLISAISCTLAVIIFAIYGNRKDWMPDSDHNYFSWSFAAAVIGSFLLWVASLLFYIEMQLTIRRNLRQGSHP